MYYPVYSTLKDQMVNPAQKPLNNNIIKIILSIVFLSLAAPVFSGELLKDQAIEYRQKGYEAQKAGMLDEALSYYQKAIHVDPFSASLYNDLGVAYEVLGQAALAEEAYLKAISLDAGYGKAYFNLAQLYEYKGDVLRAAKYWLRLLQVGAQEESLVGKAEERIYEIGKIIPEVRREYLRAESAFLNTQVVQFKERLSSDNKALALWYIEKAKVFAKKKEYLSALKLYLDAKHLDPQNDQLDALIETTQKKILL